MERKQVHAVVRGYVQGVGYRVFAQREARRLSLRGWVRNRPDGAVEVTAEGDEEALRQYVSRLDQGPAEAEVAHVELRWGPAAGEFSGFEIRSG
jgi:acylphosphatase